MKILPVETMVILWDSNDGTLCMDKNCNFHEYLFLLRGICTVHI